MLDVLLRTFPFPGDVLIYGALGVLLACGAGLPLWYERQRHISETFPYIVSPLVILWVGSLGLLALLAWWLILLALSIGVTSWLVLKGGPTEGTPQRRRDIWESS